MSLLKSPKIKHYHTINPIKLKFYSLNQKKSLNRLMKMHQMLLKRILVKRNVNRSL